MAKTNLKEIAHKLGCALDDLDAARNLAHPIIHESPGVEEASNLAAGIEALVVRAGRVVEQAAVALGMKADLYDWGDYPPYTEEDTAQEVAHGN